MTTTFLGGIVGAATIIVPGLIAYFQEKKRQKEQAYKMINMWEMILYGRN